MMSFHKLLSVAVAACLMVVAIGAQGGSSAAAQEPSPADLGLVAEAVIPREIGRLSSFLQRQSSMTATSSLPRWRSASTVPKLRLFRTATV